MRRHDKPQGHRVVCGNAFGMDALVPHLSHPWIRAAWLFGSEACNAAQPGSDVDLGLWLHDDVPDYEALGFAATLSADLQRLVHRPVDVVILNHSGSLLRFEVAWKGRPLVWQDQDERIAFEMRVRREYEDFCHIQSFYVAAMRERLEQHP